MEERLQLVPATAAAEEEIGRRRRLGRLAAVAAGKVQDSRAGRWR